MQRQTIAIVLLVVLLMIETAMMSWDCVQLKDFLPSTSRETWDERNAETTEDKPIVPNALLAKTAKSFKGGPTWRLEPQWNLTELPEVGDYDCKWVEFRPIGGKKAQMCVHPFKDIVSMNVAQFGGWVDCRILTKLWHQNYREGSIYVEIGANIGACVMQMLMTTNASIVAFEPNPLNRYCLMSTMKRMDKEYQDRLLLYPVALGARQSTQLIYSVENNMGNSVVGKVIKDQEYQKANAPLVVHVERAADILTPDGPDIALMKLDAQGYECEILNGMEGSNILERTSTVKFEFAGKWLEGHNCHDLIQRFMDAGFHVYNPDSPRPITANATFHVQDLHATRTKKT